TPAKIICGLTSTLPATDQRRALAHLARRPPRQVADVPLRRCVRCRRDNLEIRSFQFPAERRSERPRPTLRATGLALSDAQSPYQRTSHHRTANTLLPHLCR